MNQNFVTSYDCSANLASQLVHAPEQDDAFNWESPGSGNGQPFMLAQLHPMYWYQGYITSAQFMARKCCTHRAALNKMLAIQNTIQIADSHVPRNDLIQ